MTVTTETAQRHVRSALAGAPGDIDLIDLCNLAGNYMASMRSWQWLQGVEVQLPFTAGQAYVILPDDFKSLRAIRHGDAFTSSFTLVSKAHMLELKAATVSPGTFQFWGAITYARSTDADGKEIAGPLQARIDLYPAPQSNDSDSLLCYYDRLWTEITEDNTVLSMPGFVEPLYYEVLRAFALGYEEHDEGTVNDRIAAIENGPIYKAAWVTDSRTQRTYGKVQGGMALTSGYRGRRTWDNTIKGPS